MDHILFLLWLNQTTLQFPGVKSSWSSVHMTYARKSSLSRRWSLYTTRLSFPYPNGTRTDWTRMDTAKTTHDIFVGFAQILAHHCTPVQVFNLVIRVIIFGITLMAPMYDPKYPLKRVRMQQHSQLKSKNSKTSGDFFPAKKQSTGKSILQPDVRISQMPESPQSLGMYDTRDSKLYNL